MATAFPHLDALLATLDRLHGRASGVTQAHLAHVRSLLLAAGEWGEMVREAGAPVETMIREESTLLALLEAAPC